MIQFSLKEQLNNLHVLLYRLTDEQYVFQSRMLSQATIGQHVRHVIELVQCLVLEYDHGTVDYDKRKRDRRIETDRAFALEQLTHLNQSIEKPEKRLRLSVRSSSGQFTVVTGYNREIFYNTEHAIHHMALIKVALKEMELEIVDDSFGVAYATTQYNQRLSA